MEERRITVTVNGESKTVDVEPRLLLAHLLREGLALTGTHIGCDTTSCGACTVLYDGRPIKSCTMLAVQADGHEVETVEGLGVPSELDPVQEGFQQEHGLRVVGQGRHPGEVALGGHLAGQHHPHTGDVPGLAGVDRADPGVRHRAAQDLHVQHARQLDVVDVVALAPDEPVVLDPFPAGTHPADLDLV